ncbi:MAG: hypothetical protein K1W18_07005 [Oscillospiraceae bacterium]
MNKFLIVYGHDGSFFYTETSTILDAVFALANYTGNSFSEACEKAIKAMCTPSDIIELYNRFVCGYDEIQAVYKIDSILYQQKN